MPWWGWLIAAGMGLFFVAWLTTFFLAVQAHKRACKSLDETFEEMDKHYPFR